MGEKRRNTWSWLGRAAIIVTLLFGWPAAAIFQLVLDFVSRSGPTPLLETVLSALVALCVLAGSFGVVLFLKKVIVSLSKNEEILNQVRHCSSDMMKAVPPRIVEGQEQTTTDDLLSFSPDRINVYIKCAQIRKIRGGENPKWALVVSVHFVHPFSFDLKMDYKESNRIRLGLCLNSMGNGNDFEYRNTETKDVTLPTGSDALIIPGASAGKSVKLTLWLDNALLQRLREENENGKIGVYVPVSLENFDISITDGKTLTQLSRQNLMGIAHVLDIGE